jgi:hypothetical protein
VEDPAPLAYVDEHAVTLPFPDRVAWQAVERFADAALLRRSWSVLARALRTEPPGGFAVRERMPPRRLTLGGRHRFSRYRLSFELGPGAGGETVLRAVTHAAFPGVLGRGYRLLVIRSGAHAAVVRRMLRDIRRLADEGATTISG